MRLTRTTVSVAVVAIAAAAVVLLAWAMHDGSGHARPTAVAGTPISAKAAAAPRVVGRFKGGAVEVTTETLQGMPCLHSPGGIVCNKTGPTLTGNTPMLVLVTQNYETDAYAVTAAVQARVASVRLTTASGPLTLVPNTDGIVYYEGAPAQTAEAVDAHGRVLLTQQVSPEPAG